MFTSKTEALDWRKAAPVAPVWSSSSHKSKLGCWLGGGILHHTPGSLASLGPL